MTDRGGSAAITGVSETLFITLYSRVLESRRPDPIIVDPKAEEILRSVGYDFARIDVPVWSHIALALRARIIDDIVSAFISRHSDAVVIHLACGLDSRCERITPAPRAWYDLDLPDVIELRRRFYPEREQYHMISSSVLDFSWIGKIAEHGPTMIVAEGLTMYLAESDVRSLILTLHERFPGAELVFDAFSWRAVREIGRHPAITRTGARMQWGLDDEHEIERWAEGIELLEECPFGRSRHLAKVPFRRRLIFKLVGLFRAGRIAHRVLHYRL